MKYTNKYNLPDAIVKAVENDNYDSGDSDITVTQLISPMQQTKLYQQYKDQIVEDISDNIYALLGKAIHYILEKSEKVAKTEERKFVLVDGIKLSGQFDRLDLITKDGGFTGLLQDYKIASVWESIFGLNPEREKQLNCLSWILRQNGYSINKLQVVMIFRDWQKSKTTYDKSYPQKQVEIINVPLWAEKKQEKYIKNRISMFKSDVVPECTDEERWYTGDTFAVYKEGNKKAYKICKTSEEAKEWMKKNKGSMIQYRQGENKRCKYCNVSKWCPQFKKIVDSR
jgi:hypothetical protein